MPSAIIGSRAAAHGLRIFELRRFHCWFRSATAVPLLSVFWAQGAPRGLD